jgi:hypothetical protein
MLRNVAPIGFETDHEYNIYQRIWKHEDSAHPGRFGIRQLIDSFHVSGPDGSHRCLVHPPLFESVQDFRSRNTVDRFPVILLGLILQHLFTAVDFLHTECQVIHTGKLMNDNISFLQKAVFVARPETSNIR